MRVCVWVCLWESVGVSVFCAHGTDAEIERGNDENAQLCADLAARDETIAELRDKLGGSTVFSVILQRHHGTDKVGHSHYIHEHVHQVTCMPRGNAIYSLQVHSCVRTSAPHLCLHVGDHAQTHSCTDMRMQHTLPSPHAHNQEHARRRCMHCTAAAKRMSNPMSQPVPKKDAGVKHVSEHYLNA